MQNGCLGLSEHANGQIHLSEMVLSQANLFVSSIDTYGNAIFPAGASIEFDVALTSLASNKTGQASIMVRRVDRWQCLVTHMEVVSTGWKSLSSGWPSALFALYPFAIPLRLDLQMTG
jgi:hypothetical protein